MPEIDLTDRDSWLPALYHDQWAALVRIACLLGAHDDAQRCAAAALVASYRRNPKVRSWDQLVTHVRVRLVTQVRAERRSAEAAGPGASLWPDLDRLDGLDPQVVGALEGLSRRQQEVIALSQGAGLGVAQVADALGMTQGSVRTQRERAIAEIAAARGWHGEQDDAEVRAEAVLQTVVDECLSRVVVGDHFDEVMEAAGQSRSARRGPSRRTVVVSSAVALLAGIAIPFLTSSQQSTSGDGPVEENAPRPSGGGAGQSLATLQTGLAVFYLGREDGLLYRELRDLPTLGDRLGTAVAAVLNVAPLDPDFTSGWSGGQVNKATVEGDRIVLDLSASAFSQFTSRGQEEAAIRQLVYTATAAVGDHTGQRSVRLLVDGSPNLPFIGQPETDFVTDGMTPCALIWTDVPESGATVSAGTLTISGLVQPKVGSMSYLVRSVKGDRVVSRGAVTIVKSRTHTWNRWSAEVTVPAGELEIAVSGGLATETTLVTAT